MTESARSRTELDQPAIAGATMTDTNSTAYGDICIGGEPYDVLDDVKMLRHVPCGIALAGENAIASHVCAESAE